MHYLLLPFMVGSIYEGSSTEYLRFIAQDAEDFKTRLFCAMDDYVQDLNQKRCGYSQFSFEGQEFPEQGFFFYDIIDDLWSCHEPELIELASKESLDCFIVETTIGDGCSYSFPCYKMVWADSRAAVEAELDKAYTAFRADGKLSSYSVLGTDFEVDELVGCERYYGKDRDVQYFNTLDSVCSLEEFFSKEAIL